MEEVLSKMHIGFQKNVLSSFSYTEYRHQRTSLDRREEVMKNLDKNNLSKFNDLLSDFLEYIGLSTHHVWWVFVLSFLTGVVLFLMFRFYIVYYFH